MCLPGGHFVGIPHGAEKRRRPSGSPTFRVAFFFFQKTAIFSGSHVWKMQIIRNVLWIWTLFETHLLAFFSRRLVKCCNRIKNAFTLILNIQNSVFRTRIVTVTAACTSTLACNTTECETSGWDNDIGTACTGKTGQASSLIRRVRTFQNRRINIAVTISC